MALRAKPDINKRNAGVEQKNGEGKRREEGQKIRKSVMLVGDECHLVWNERLKALSVANAAVN